MHARCCLVVLTLLVLATACQAQKRPDKAPEYITNPSSILRPWNLLGAHKEVTHQFPTDYQLGGLYRLRKDVVVGSGGTGSRVTKYWVESHDPQKVEDLKERLRDPEAAKERDIQDLRTVSANLVGAKAGTEVLIRGMRVQRETRSIMSAGTRLRFRQIWLEGNFETGVYVKGYAEVLDGPLQGKWINISFISDRGKNYGHACNVDPECLEYVGR